MGKSKLPEIALAARGLVKVYSGAEHPALAGLDITIEAGEIFGLLGPNGAGKTTAISIMSTLLRPTGGSVEIFGLDVQKNPAAVKEIVGLVPQDIALYKALSARENLSYFARLYGLYGIEATRRVDECLELVGLAESADQRVGLFSGGMKRRVNLAIGILHRPRLLFLDEPTVGIDAQSRNMIMDRLDRLNTEGTTMLYTTHYMEEAEKLCSAVAIMDHGQVISQGRPANLMQQCDCATLQELFISLTGHKLRD